MLWIHSLFWEFSVLSSSALFLLLSPLSICSSLLLHSGLFCLKSLHVYLLFVLAFWLWISYIHHPPAPLIWSDWQHRHHLSSWREHSWQLPFGRVKLPWIGSYSLGFTPVGPAGLLAVSLYTLKFLPVWMVNHVITLYVLYLGFDGMEIRSRVTL